MEHFYVTHQNIDNFSLHKFDECMGKVYKTLYNPFNIGKIEKFNFQDLDIFVNFKHLTREPQVQILST